MANVKNYFSQPEDSDNDNIFNVTGTMNLGTTQLTATGAELNKNDISAETEIILAAGAVSVNNKITKLALVGTGAVTLAVPDASMLGFVKIIEMTEDNGDVTLALTNIQGGSAATTCTWANIGEALVLVAGVSKWNVIGEGGVVLS